MKLRRLLAAILVLVLTATPIVNATSGETDPIVLVTNPETQSISAVDTSLVLWSGAVKHSEGAGFVERGSTDGYYGDHPRIDTLLATANGEFNKSGEEWPWIAYKVSVPAADTYTLGVTTNSCKWADFKLPMVVGGEVHTLTYTAKAQTQTAEVTLPAGEHTVVVFWPMPANESEVYEGADWNSYLWCNIASAEVDSALTVSKPTVAEVEAVFAPKVAPVDQTIAAIDTSLVLWSGAVKHSTGAEFVERGSTDGYYGDHPRIDTLLATANGEFNKSGEEWPWIAYKVSVPADGAYTLGVTTNSCKWADFKLPMVVGGEVHTLTYTAKAQTQTAEVTLPAGEHTVVIFWPMPANESEVYEGADWNSYLWCNIASMTVASGLTVSKPTVSEVEAVFAPAVKEDTVIPAVDTNYILLSANMQVSGTKVGCANQGNVRYDKPLIESLYIDAYEQFNASGTEWNWFAYKITVPAAGTYTLGVETAGCKNASYTIPLCVNGKAYTLTYTANAQKVTTEVELPKGEYVVTVFSPMPANAAAVTGTDNVDYPWCDFSNVVVDYALTASKPTVAEVEACFPAPADTVIPAVNTDYILLSNNMVVNGTKIGCANQGNVRFDAPLIESLYSDAAGQFNKSGEEWNWFAYKITVPADGTYTLGVETAGCKNTSYTIPLCVNGKAYTLTYTANAQKVTTEVELPKGEYVVTVFSPMPANAAAVTGTDNVDYPWCDFSTIVVDYALTASKPTVAEVEACFPAPADTVIPAVNTDYILLSANMKINDTKLGCINQGHVRSDKPLIETLYTDAYEQFNASGEEWNWFAYKITVPADGTYTLGVETAGCKNTSYTIPVCVNGKAYTLTYTANAQKVTTEVELPKGEYVVTVFSPMPANAAAVTGTDNVDYPWCDFSNVVVDHALTASKPTVAEVEACFPAPADTVIPAVNTDYILLSANMKIDDTKLGCMNQGHVRSDKPLIETLYTDAYEQFNASGAEWNWFAYKITVPAAGTYTLGVETAGCKNASYTIPLCVNGKAYTLTYTANAQKVTTEVELPAGEHVVVVFSPMPANEAAVTGTDNVDYPWCDFSNVVVDHVLTASKPTVAEVEACFPKVDLGGDTVLSATDTRMLLSETVGVKTESGVNVIYCVQQDYVRADVPYIDSLLSDVWGEFNQSGEEWNWFAYKVNAPQDGTFAMSVKVQNCKADAYKIPMVVDGEVHTLIYTAKNQTVTENVTLPAGEHIVVIFMPMPQNEVEANGGVWNDHPWCNVEFVTVDGRLEVSKPTEAEVDARFPYAEIAPGNEELVLINKFRDNGDTLSEADLDDMRVDMPAIDSLPYSGNLISRWPFISMKVNAPNDGNYTIRLKMDVKPEVASKQMGVLLDGEAYSAPLKFYSELAGKNAESASITVYLTAGNHNITFFAPMPKDLASNTKNIYNDYAWIDLSSIRMTPGLTVSEKITLEEITQPLGNRIEAENGEYAVYNLTNSKDTPQANAKASGGYLIGDTWNSNITQTYKEVAAWLNSNKQAYIEYAVIAPESGEYDIAVGFQAGASDKTVAKPYIAVIVNNTAYKAQFTKDWDQVEAVKLTVKLEKGMNIIRCTSVTVDQEIYKKGWINHDFIDLDKRLTPVKHSSAFMEAEKAKYYNKFEVQDGDKAEGATGTGKNGKVLGKSDRKYVSGLKLTLDKLRQGQLKQVPYFSVTVNAPMNGYYPISLKMSIDGRQKSSTIGMLVDGNVRTVKYDKVGKQAKDGEVDTLVYLTAGEHILTFTTPMPANSGINAKYSYYWCNYDSITLYNGLSIAKNQKAPTSEPDYTRIEVEKCALFNLCADNGHAAGNGYYKVSQSLDEIKKDGIDGSRTPYVELTVNAKKAGSYVIYLGNTHGITQGGNWEKVYGQFVVEVNGQLQTKAVEITKAGASTITQVYVEMEEGENTIRLTHLTSDAQHGGTTWIDFDYIEMPSWVAGNLEFVERGTRIEAEDANYDAFAEMPSGSYSGGSYLGRANYDTIEELDITHDTLDPKDLGGLPHVRYRVFTEKAGTYNLTVGYAAGLTNYPANEIAQGVKASFTVVVNNETKQRVEFNLKSASANMARIITVDLLEGENEIIVTGTTSEYVIDRKPRIDETYRLVWIDQDYIDLSAGVTSTSTDEQIINIDDSDIDFAQLIVKEKTDDQDSSGVSGTKSANGLGWIFIPSGAGAALLLIILLVIKKRKKKKE